jgi:signal transduction histidine kinase
VKIKNRLSLYFTLIASGVLLVVLFAIYTFFASFLHNAFFNNLVDRANVAAQLYLKADEITADSLNRVRNKYLKNLPGEVIRIYDKRNSAAFIRDDQQYWNGAVIDQVRKKGYLQFYDANRQVVGNYYHDNQGNFVILVSADDVEGVKRLHTLFDTMIALFVIVNSLLFFVGRWFAQNALSPINKVVNQMQLIKATNLNLRVDEGNGKDEISELARNFNRLLAHLENAFELQRMYVSNASHELRTPVTSIIGEVELALSKIRSPAELAETLQRVLEDAEKLQDTITGLMELAQVDMDYTSAELAPVRMDELVWEVHEYWTTKLGNGKLLINILQLPPNEGLLTIAANKQLMLIAINNLVSNAFKFSNQKPVTCAFYADDKVISLKITDQGIGIPAADIEKVFGSFYRGGNAFAYAGTGIGLYIAQKIVQLFRGNLTVNSTEGQFTTVNVDFFH